MTVFLLFGWFIVVTTPYGQTEATGASASKRASVWIRRSVTAGPEFAVVITQTRGGAEVRSSTGTRFNTLRILSWRGTTELVIGNTRWSTVFCTKLVQRRTRSHRTKRAQRCRFTVDTNNVFCHVYIGAIICRETLFRRLIRHIPLLPEAEITHQLAFVHLLRTKLPGLTLRIGDTRATFCSRCHFRIRRTPVAIAITDQVSPLELTARGVFLSRTLYALIRKGSVAG
jgi:hypothetical protein